MELLNISHPKKLVVYIQNLKGMSEQNTIHYFGLVVDQCHFWIRIASECRVIIVIGLSLNPAYAFWEGYKLELVFLGIDPPLISSLIYT